MANSIIPVFPIEGDVLHNLDGSMVGDKLEVAAEIQAPPGCNIHINDEKAIEKDGKYTTALVLKEYKNNVLIKNISAGEEISFPVYWAPKFAGGYRLSIDDNIRFLEDIAQNKDRYKSIFENPFLKGLKNLYDKYGTKIHLNLFYQNVEGNFNLSQMPETFKPEFEANSHWLRFSFHAYAEFPDEPYINAPYDVVKKDCDLIMGEIKRFAGAALLGPVTTIHWGGANVEGSRAMRDAGYTGQLGYFNVDDDQYPVSYYLTVEQRRHMKKRFIWKDEKEGIIFIRSSVVIDKTEKEDIIPNMEKYRETRGALPPYVDFLVHEQYFYPDYFNYQPDYFEKLETAIKWAKDNNYEPRFLEECIFN